MSRFDISVLKPAQDGNAVKRRLLDPNGALVKSDHTLFVKMWLMANVSVPNDADSVAELLRGINSRSDLTTVHGAVAPGISPSELQPRWVEGSAAGKGENLYAFAEQVRDEILPRAFRHCELVIRASSSTGLNPCHGSLHCYALLDQPVPLTKAYRFLKGLQASGLPFDPRPTLPGQLFLSGRPEFVGLPDPVPEHLRVFVLPGLQRVAHMCDIDWEEHEPQFAAREATERRARSVGVGLGWRAVLDNFLGDGEGKLGFYETLSRALGHAARSNESADEIVSVMHAIVSGHPDLTPERAGQHTLQWLRRELMRLRAKDAAREADIDARVNAIRGRFPGMGFWT